MVELCICITTSRKAPTTKLQIPTLACHRQRLSPPPPDTYSHNSSNEKITRKVMRKHAVACINPRLALCVPIQHRDIIIREKEKIVKNDK